MSAEVFYVGKRQAALIDRAQRSRYSFVMPKDYPELRACRRLEARGIFVTALSWPNVWKLTAIAKIVEIRVTQ